MERETRFRSPARCPTAVAYRQRLHLTRELVIASVRAGVQLVAVGALLLVIFAHAGLPGAFAWISIK